MTELKTILDPDELNHLIDLRNQISRAILQFHLLGHQANKIGTPTLARLCLSIADQLADAKARANRAILFAASEKHTHV